MQLDLPFLSGPNPDAVELSHKEPQPPPVIEFVRVRRARRYILRIRPDGTLRVTVPRGGSRREAEQFVRKHQRWIRRERDRVQVERAPREWTHGSEILLRGVPVRIAVAGADDGLTVSYGERRVAVAAIDEIRPAIETDLKALAEDEIIARLRRLGSEHNVEPGAISIRNQRSRWGSCARNGNIALNFRLVQMPPAVRDYVLLHELMHIKQQNHSRRFWRLVETVCPAFRDAERWLRTTGKTLF
ncbi:MAG TPA: SprT family zinc-dependent metalloprotease [Vicinamibacterales bacterium]